MVKGFNDAERIRTNYCKQMIRHMLIYRFSMEELRRIAKKQGMQRSLSLDKLDRHVEEFNWFEDKIYKALGEPIRKTIVKYVQMWFSPRNSIELLPEDHKNWGEFENIMYEIVK